MQFDYDLMYQFSINIFKSSDYSKHTHICLEYILIRSHDVGNALCWETNPTSKQDHAQRLFRKKFKEQAIPKLYIFIGLKYLF